MNFIELNRFFVPIGKDKEPLLRIEHTWGRQFAGWLQWSDLLKYNRVVLLAEASSGKSTEFRHQVDTLVGDGKPAFLVRIGELADHGVETSL